MLLDEFVSDLTSTGVNIAKAPGSTSTLAWTVFKSLMPPSPDKAVSVVETPGLSPFGRFNMGQPSWQVRVRGESMNDSATAYTDARSIIEKIRKRYHARKSSTMNGSYYAGLWAEQEPFSLGYDENNRPEFAINFRALRDST